MHKQIFLFLIFILNVSREATNPKVAVFCSGDNKISRNFKTCAFELGEYLGSHNFGLIIGGNSGLMKEIANGYVSKTHSLENFQNILLQHYSSDFHPEIHKENIIQVETLQDRLNYFYNNADVFIMLPGGFGTLHEFINCIIHNKNIKKPIILLNINGFWDNQIKQFHKIIMSNPEASIFLESLIVVNTLSDCSTALKNNF
jgi:uncharacterized protein (TIGR00730 family)